MQKLRVLNGSFFIVHRKDAKNAEEKLVFLNIMPTGNSNYRVVINKLSSKIIVAAIEEHFFKWLLLLSVLSTESNKRLYLSVLCVSAVSFCFSQ
jgi:hypothetical protein